MQYTENISSFVHPRLNYLFNAKTPSTKIFTTTSNELFPQLLSLSSSKQIPFSSISEVTPKNIIQILRSNVKLCFKETKDIYEGEVTQLNVDPKAEITLTIRTLKGSKKLRFNNSLYAVLKKENIEIGDIIYIEINSGIIKRLGRSESCQQDCDIECERFVPVPKGEVLRRREVTQEMTLYDIDTANAKPNSGILGSILNTLNTEVNVGDDLRSEVDRIICEYIQKEVCILKVGIILINDGDNLDMKMLKLLKYMSDQLFSPFIFIVLKEARLDMLNLSFDSAKELQIKNLCEYEMKKWALVCDEELVQKILEFGMRNGQDKIGKLVRLMKAANFIDEAVFRKIEDICK